MIRAVVFDLGQVLASPPDIHSHPAGLLGVATDDFAAGYWTGRQAYDEGGSDAAAKQAYEAARRAILRCQKDGYKLPAEKYNRWKTTIIDFNPGGGARIN